MASPKRRACNVGSDEVKSPRGKDRLRPEVVRFINDDDTCSDVVIGKASSAVEVCKLVARHNRKLVDPDWTITEDLGSMNLAKSCCPLEFDKSQVYFLACTAERNLEDHEDVLIIKSTWSSSGYIENQFCFGKDAFKKYDYMKNPMDFFPFDMVVPVDDQGNYLSTLPEAENRIAMQKTLMETDKAPIVYGYIYGSLGIENDNDDDDDDEWMPIYFVLKENSLYYSEECPKTDKIDTSHMTKLLDLINYDIYLRHPGGKNFNCRARFYLCLKTCPFALLACAVPEENLHILACETEELRFRWITAMRIHKYGRTLRNNYDTYKLRKENMPDGNENPTVAAECLGAVGGLDALTISLDTLKLTTPEYCTKIGGGILQGLSNTIHLSQSWFHPRITWKDTRKLLKRTSKDKGLFLVRDGLFEFEGKFVLSYLALADVHDCHILVVDKDGNHTKEENGPVYYQMFCENYHTKDNRRQPIFYDLIQLVEYYYLNPTPLLDKLTRYFGPPPPPSREDIDIDSD